MISLQPGKLVVAAALVVKELELGGSVAVNGACLTATAFDSASFGVDLSPETLQRTALGKLKTGDPLNLERPMELGPELGGHLVQGHIDGTGIITSIVPQNGATLINFIAPAEIMRYLVEKAYIAVEGISLTITALEADSFQVSVVDFTRTHTNLQYHKVGDSVNLEVDIMAKYAERFVQAQKSRISTEFLREHGFRGFAFLRGGKTNMALATIPEAIAEIKAGKFIIIVDNEDRENEGDLAIAAEKVTPDIINFYGEVRPRLDLHAGHRSETGRIGRAYDG